MILVLSLEPDRLLYEMFDILPLFQLADSRATRYSVCFVPLD